MQNIVGGNDRVNDKSPRNVVAQHITMRNPRGHFCDCGIIVVTFVIVESYPVDEQDQIDDLTDVPIDRNAIAVVSPLGVAFDPCSLGGLLIFAQP